MRDTSLRGPVVEKLMCEKQDIGPLRSKQWVDVQRDRPHA